MWSRRLSSFSTSRSLVQTRTRGQCPPTADRRPAAWLGMSARHALNRDFRDMYEQALECDGWGDVDAAETAYRRLRDAVLGAAETHAGDLSRWELQQTAKLVSTLSLRVDELRTGRDLGVGSSACKELRAFFKAYLTQTNAEFPFDVDPEAVGAPPVCRALERTSVGASAASEVVTDRTLRPGSAAEARTTGSLLPPVRLRGRGDRALILKLIKIGIKDAGAGGYIDARATVSVTRTPSGSLLEATQETPVALGRESQHVVFDNDTFVHVQTPLRELEAGIDAAGGDVSFVIELRHFKPKKKKTSVKGWCFFSLSELDLSRQTTQLSLEVYAKPTDLRCKKMSLLSVKELYAHVDVIVHTE